MRTNIVALPASAQRGGAGRLAPRRSRAARPAALSGGRSTTTRLPGVVTRGRCSRASCATPDGAGPSRWPTGATRSGGRHPGRAAARGGLSHGGDRASRVPVVEREDGRKAGRDGLAERPAAARTARRSREETRRVAERVAWRACGISRSAGRKHLARDVPRYFRRRASLDRVRTPAEFHPERSAFCTQSRAGGGACVNCVDFPT